MMIPEPSASPETVPSAAAPPPGYEDYAGEILVANGKMPRWFTRLPYVAIVLAVGYYVWARAFDPINMVFAGLFILWMLYTPIAQKRGWFHIPM